MPSCYVISKADAVNTRMHFSSRPLQWPSAWPREGCLPGHGVQCLPDQGVRCLPGQVVSAWLGGCLPGQEGCTPSPLWTDRHLSKHNLSATTVADGKYFEVNGKSENNQLTTT